MVVKTPARLHLGVLNPNPIEKSERKYGGFGVAIKDIGFEIEVEKNSQLRITTENQKKRVKKIIQKLANLYNISTSVKVKINRAIPKHVGLGSTTQLFLGLAKALTRLFEKDVPILDIARDIGRGKRSGVGTYAFSEGGFVVEGGRERKEFPPLIVRHNFPEDWKFVVAIPNIERGPEEEGEQKYFEKLGPEANVAKEICYLLVLESLPALVDRNISAFGKTLTEIDELVGRAFSSKQGGIFRGEVSDTRSFMLDNGAYGVGQSSWGPAVYGLVNGEKQARKLEEKVKDYLRKENLMGEVMTVNPDNEGARLKVENSQG
ncbi:hypothetical protein AKJ49_00425 [candidate division MSBL1 archaeon SCGC-AAA382A03]|uniref:Beta-ribofuranosylaminobenzene 5'-phosphate synthase n=1 Tax=candidate division MSBL1 archaeon SCGC-AAA382A03 TaxID=1698278 RepID=A0A133VGP2_9EURY|nr:hypothetical protein AKJ49_00425 [candidate division MSBL1 archaeon SCGC-AAA382A03]